MSIGDKKIVHTIIKECNDLDQKCPGYRSAILDLITDILAIERGHQVSATRVQQKVNDKFRATGRWLAASRQKVGPK